MNNFNRSKVKSIFIKKEFGRNSYSFIIKAPSRYLGTVTQWRDFEHSKEWRQILKLTEYICTTKHTYTMIIIMICKRKQDRGNKWYHTSVLAFSFFFLSRGKFIVQWQSINLRCLWNMIPIWTTNGTQYIILCIY